MKKLRQSRVEPVFGTLLEYLGMRKVNTRGIQQANKSMLMAAIAYNLKKYLKFIEKELKIAINEQTALCLMKKKLIEQIKRSLRLQKYSLYFN